jgi:hypothetical protein
MPEWGPLAVREQARELDDGGVEGGDLDVLQLTGRGALGGGVDDDPGRAGEDGLVHSRLPGLSAPIATTSASSASQSPWSAGVRCGCRRDDEVRAGDRLLRLRHGIRPGSDVGQGEQALEGRTVHDRRGREACGHGRGP